MGESIFEKNTYQDTTPFSAPTTPAAADGAGLSGRTAVSSPAARGEKVVCFLHSRHSLPNLVISRQWPILHQTVTPRPKQKALCANDSCAVLAYAACGAEVSATDTTDRSLFQLPSYSHK